MEFIKQRLVGAIVILGFFVAVIPAVFNGSGIMHNSSSDAGASAYQSVLNQQVAATPAMSYRTPVIKQVRHDQASAWTVRVGAFSNFEVANQLKQKLHENGYVTYLQILPDSDLYGVFVGPEVVAHNAEVVMEQLSEQMNLQGVVVPYEPVLYVQNS